ncbi:MAG: O-antigen ligase family protein [Terracidiphilus sp.]
MIADRFTPMPAFRAEIPQGAFVEHGEVGQAKSWLFTPASVGFYFSFRAAIVLIAVRVFLLEPQIGAAAVLALDFLLLLVVVFQAMGPATHSLRWMLRQPSFRWVIAYLALAGCSLLWSASVSKSASFLYWCGVVADVTVVVLLLRAGPVQGVAHSLMRGYIWSTCILAMSAWIMPTRADLRLGDMEFFNTNQIGNLCAFAILLAQYLMCRKDGKWGVPILFLTITLVRSLSKTTLVAFLCSEGFLLVRDQSMSRKTKSLIGVVVLLVGLAFWGLYESYYDVYTTAGNQAETLTGRTAIWAFAANAAIEKPWFGNGFDALWKVMPPFGADQFEARHAENELLQQFFAYGVAGVVMLAGLYGSLYRKIRRLPHRPTRMIFFTILLFVVIRGLAEAEPFDLLLPLWGITLFSSVVTMQIDANGENRLFDSNRDLVAAGSGSQPTRSATL